MSSGPLDPSDVTLFTSYPSPIVVPLEFIEEQSKSSREELEIDESGLYIMSKALVNWKNVARFVIFYFSGRIHANSDARSNAEWFPTSRLRFNCRVLCQFRVQGAER